MITQARCVLAQLGVVQFQTMHVHICEDVFIQAKPSSPFKKIEQTQISPTHHYSSNPIGIHWCNCQLWVIDIVIRTITELCTCKVRWPCV